MVKCNDIFIARTAFVWKTVQSVISILFLIGMASVVHGQIELIIPEALSIKEGQAGDQTLPIEVSCISAQFIRKTRHRVNRSFYANAIALI